MICDPDAVIRNTASPRSLVPSAESEQPVDAGKARWIGRQDTIAGQTVYIWSSGQIVEGMSY